MKHQNEHATSPEKFPESQETRGIFGFFRVSQSIPRRLEAPSVSTIDCHNFSFWSSLSRDLLIQGLDILIDFDFN